MKLKVEKSSLEGRVEIPGSKSHTIRALVVSSLAEGRSEILRPLESSDTSSCVDACRAMGATIEKGEVWTVQGTGGRPSIPDDVINVGNSGTTARLVTGMASLASPSGFTVITGDKQTRRRPFGSLLAALSNLGAEVRSTCREGALPVIIRGRLKGGLLDDHVRLRKVQRTTPPRTDTRKNVADSDGTLWMGNVTSRGALLTLSTCHKTDKPHIVNPTAPELRAWLLSTEIATLNVAGNRERTNPGISARTAWLIQSAVGVTDPEVG